MTRAAPKAPGSFDRQVHPDVVLSALSSLRRRYGITRVGDATRLDRVGIPVVTAFVPRSPDALGVYNGKGVTLRDATIGAVMEACERQIAARYEPQTIACTPDEITANLDLAAMQINPAFARAPLECVIGTDLLSDREIPVPHALVMTPWHKAPLFPYTHTSGLASGSTVLEATYHAVLELVERHHVSLAHVRSHVIPARIAQPGLLERDTPYGCDVERPTGDSILDDLFERIDAAGLQSRCILLDSEPAYTMLVTMWSREPDGISPQSGMGSSLSPIHAALRAITEAAQSRVVEIQGAREDISRLTPFAGTGRWFVDVPCSKRVTLSSLADASSDDLAQDLRRVLHGLGRLGVRTVASVTLQSDEICVVRAFAAELESYVVDGRFGATIRGQLERLRAVSTK